MIPKRKHHMHSEVLAFGIIVSLDRASRGPASASLRRAARLALLAPAGQTAAASTAAGLRPANRQSENHRYKQLVSKCCLSL